MRPPFGSQVFERAQELVDRRRLVVGLCAAVAIALIAAIPGVVTSAGRGKHVRTTEFAQVTPTTLPGEGVVNPVAGAPATVPMQQSPPTTQAAIVLGTTFARGPTTTVPKATTPKTTTKPAALPPAPNPTTGSTAPLCRNSYNPSCGPFRWEPPPAQNQPRQVTLSGPSEPVRAGDQVKIHAVVNDPDDSQAFKCPSTTYDFADGPKTSTHCDPPPGTDPCPKRYGPWTPPAASPGGGQEDVAHTFSTPGTYTVTFTYDPGVDDACYNPYADGGSGTVQITVTP